CTTFDQTRSQWVSSVFFLVNNIFTNAHVAQLIFLYTLLQGKMENHFVQEYMGDVSDTLLTRGLEYVILLSIFSNYSIMFNFFNKTIIHGRSEFWDIFAWLNYFEDL
ncbi:hypothetical protein ACJX0J_039395, partial [Zea mays]